MPSAEDLIKQLHAQRTRARRRESVIMERVYTPPAGGGGGGGSDNLSAPAPTELVLRVMQQFQEATAALHRRMDELHRHSSHCHSMARAHATISAAVGSVVFTVLGWPTS